MEANRADAEKALATAELKRSQGDDAASSKWVEKSLRLFPTPEAASLASHFLQYGPGSKAAKAVARVLQAGSHQEVLGLTPIHHGWHAAPAIKKAYKTRCLEIHPDRNRAPYPLVVRVPDWPPAFVAMICCHVRNSWNPTLRRER